MWQYRMAGTDHSSGIFIHFYLITDLGDHGSRFETQGGEANVVLQTQVATHRMRNTELVQVILLTLTLCFALAVSSCSCSLVTGWLSSVSVTSRSRCFMARGKGKPTSRLVEHVHGSMKFSVLRSENVPFLYNTWPSSKGKTQF